MSDENKINKKDSTNEAVCSAPEKPELVEEIIKQLNAPPAAKNLIKESLAVLMSVERRPPPVPVEGIKAMAESLRAESQDNKEVTLKEIEFRENQAVRDFEMNRMEQKHDLAMSKVKHWVSVVVTVAVLGFAGWQVQFGDKELGKQILGLVLAFVAGFGANKLFSRSD